MSAERVRVRFGGEEMRVVRLDGRRGVWEVVWEKEGTYVYGSVFGEYFVEVAEELDHLF